MHLRTKKLDIIRLENKKILTKKIYQIQQSKLDIEEIENELIDIMVSTCISHGKDENQIRQISQISKVLGQSLGLGTQYCDMLEKAAKIYDIGNIAICMEVYSKDDKLSFEEFNIVKQHTLLGCNILTQVGCNFTDLAAIISKEHHEWWNGSGYPVQIKKEEINIASRIVAVADVVGALFRKRPGRSVWSYDKILDYIKQRSGVQFDENVINVFLINQKAIREILMTDLESVPSAWYA